MNNVGVPLVADPSPGLLLGHWKTRGLLTPGFSKIWQLDVIHIEEGTEYDGYFEGMADRIVKVKTPVQKEIILRLKFETPVDKDYHGVEYYEAVIADDIENMNDFEEWVMEHRKKPAHYWKP